jgi:arsenate reductase
MLCGQPPRRLHRSIWGDRSVTNTARRPQRSLHEITATLRAASVLELLRGDDALCDGAAQVLEGDVVRGMGRRTSLVAIAVITCVVSAGASLIAASADEQAEAGPAKPAKPPTVLFMCPHGAAKSVLASAYFQRLAKERGLNVRVESAATQPDAEVAPAVASHLTKNGYAVIAKPRRVTSEDLAMADVVISIGCDVKGLPLPANKLRTWDDVPSPSEDFARADEAIRKRVVDLVEELVRKRQVAR